MAFSMPYEPYNGEQSDYRGISIRQKLMTLKEDLRQVEERMEEVSKSVLHCKQRKAEHEANFVYSAVAFVVVVGIVVVITKLEGKVETRVNGPLWWCLAVLAAGLSMSNILRPLTMRKQCLREMESLKAEKSFLDRSWGELFAKLAATTTMAEIEEQQARAERVAMAEMEAKRVYNKNPANSRIERICEYVGSVCSSVRKLKNKLLK